MVGLTEILEILKAREQRRVEIQATDLSDFDYFTHTDGRLWMKRDLQPTLIANPSTRTVPQYMDGDEFKTKQQAVVFDDDAVGFAEDAIFAAPGRIEVLQIFAEATMSAVAANRNITVQVSHIATQIPVIPWDLMVTSAILLTADQDGSITFPGRSDTIWTNDNTVIAAVADENIIPLFLEEEDLIICQSDNDQLGDILGVSVWYRTAE